MNMRPLIEVTRGNPVESVHHGTIALVNAAGRLLWSWSDPNRAAFMRSSAKPFQALPFLESGAADNLEVSARELALVCASHTGREQHLEVLAGLLSRTIFNRDQLQCGRHQPLDKDAARRLATEGAEPSVLHNNCAGKHLGMLASAAHLGYPLENYLAADHPLQRQILADIEELMDLPEAAITIGIDGCSAPNFSVPVKSMALAFARLADPAGLRQERQQSLSQIYAAMTEHPDLISGPAKLDAVLMKQGKGQLIAKEGAEGVLAMGLKDFDGGGLGIAIKVWDGDPRGRALAAAALEVLDQVGWLRSSQRQVVEAIFPAVVKTRRGRAVGEIRPCFQLERSNG